MQNKKHQLTVLLGCALLQFSHSISNAATTDTSSVPEPGAPDINLFLDGALAEEATIEDCTLTNGSETQCYRITIVGRPVNAVEGEIEIYCPDNRNSTAKEGGLWFDGSGTVYDVDGEFMENLASLYDDDRWKMVDQDTGEITVYEGAEGCEIAGNPNPSTPDDNFCLECSLDALNGGVQKTFLIPVSPEPLDNAARLDRGDSGVAFNGVIFGPPAPVDLILGSYTLGVFDDCAAHANPHDGYHYHGANGCADIVAQPDGHSPQMGIAMDGYGIFARYNEAGELTEELDECGGATDPIRGYHYHAGDTGSNKILGCFSGAQGSIEGGEQRGGPGGSRPPRDGQGPRDGERPPNRPEPAEG